MTLYEDKLAAILHYLNGFSDMHELSDDYDFVAVISEPSPENLVNLVKLGIAIEEDLIIPDVLRVITNVGQEDCYIDISSLAWDYLPADEGYTWTWHPYTRKWSYSVIPEEIYY